MNRTVRYLCDRRGCKKCVPECNHTNDISHATNFELFNDEYVEKDLAVINISVPKLNIRDRTYEQLPWTGLHPDYDRKMIKPYPNGRMEHIENMMEKY